jgi:hypothetical protein
MIDEQGKGIYATTYKYDVEEDVVVADVDEVPVEEDVGHRDRVADPPVLQHAPDRHRRGSDRLRTDIEPLSVRACQADHVLRRRRLRGGRHTDRSFSSLGFLTYLFCLMRRLCAGE